MRNKYTQREKKKKDFPVWNPLQCRTCPTILLIKKYIYKEKKREGREKEKGDFFLRDENLPLFRPPPTESTGETARKEDKEEKNRMGKREIGPS